MKRLLLMTAICLTAGTVPVSAQTEKTSPGPGAVETASQADNARYWYDGPKKRTIRLSEDLVAEMSDTGTPGRVKALDPGATLTGKGSATVRIYKLSAGKKARDVVKAAEVAGSTVRHSEVFRDGRGGRLRSLPGDVIVVFRKDWTEEQSQNWLTTRKLAVKEKLGFTKNAYLVDAPSGEAGLDLANRLFETGDLKISAPNWWIEARTK